MEVLKVGSEVLSEISSTRESRTGADELPPGTGAGKLRGGLLAWLLAIGLSTGLSVYSLDRWEAIRKHDQGLLSVPPVNVVRMLACGYRNMMADVFYMRFTTYWGYWLTHGRKFHNLFPLLEIVVELDPEFKSAYEVGALALADSGQVMKAVDLLTLGYAKHPKDWWYPYQSGLMLYLYSDDYLLAGRYFEDASRIQGAPPEAGFFAARMYQEGKKKDLAIATWVHIYESGDKNVRVVAARALKKLGIDLGKLGRPN